MRDAGSAGSAAATAPSPGSSLSGGAIAGIAVGASAATVLATAAAWLLLRRRCRRRREKEQEKCDVEMALAQGGSDDTSSQCPDSAKLLESLRLGKDSSSLPDSLKKWLVDAHDIHWVLDDASGRKRLGSGA